MNALVEAHGLIVERGQRRLLDRVGLSLRPGELMVLVGPNGAGKSTLLGCLSGAIRPQQGQVRFAGRPLDSWPAAALARQRAVLRQGADIGFAFTVREVVELGRSPHHGIAGQRADQAAVARALAMAGIAHLERRTCTTLSGGERQRVHAARVLAQLLGDEAGLDGTCLLLDEPTAALDLRHQLEMMQVARRLAGLGCAVLAILHDLGLAARFADRIAVLDHGRLVAEGPADAALAPDVVAGVFGVRIAWGAAGGRPMPVIEGVL